MARVPLLLTISRSVRSLARGVAAITDIKEPLKNSITPPV